MTVEELIIYAKKYIHSTYAKMLLADLLGVNSLELLNYLDKVVDNETVDIYIKKVEALRDNKPIQYVIGNVNFYGQKFIINENVLIPRFETEELVENTIIYINQIFDNTSLKLIDLGTGSGCIGLTLKNKINNLDVTLLDISPKALEIASENANNLCLNVRLVENDMLSGINDKFDIIISNPPYIKDNEEIEALVRDNEPHLALYAGLDGLDYYCRILKEAPRCLNDRFLIAFEIGETQGEDIKKLAEESFPKAEIVIRKDMQGRDRMIFIYSK